MGGERPSPGSGGSGQIALCHLEGAQNAEKVTADSRMGRRVLGGRATLQPPYL